MKHYVMPVISIRDSEIQFFPLIFKSNPLHTEILTLSTPLTGCSTV